MIEPQYTSNKGFLFRIVDKLMSARFLVAVMMVGTACILSVKKVPIDKDFMILLTMVVTSYFGRGDRKNKEEK